MSKSQKNGKLQTTKRILKERQVPILHLGSMVRDPKIGAPASKVHTMLNGKTWFIYCVKHKSNYNHGQSPKTSCMSSGKTWLIYCVIYKSNYNHGQPHKTSCICCNLLSYYTKTTKRMHEIFLTNETSSRIQSYDYQLSSDI